MIHVGSYLIVTDNSGGKVAQCIKVLRKSNRMYGSVGDIIVVALKKVLPGKKVKKGEVYRAVVVRTKKQVIRLDGSTVSFEDNSVVLLTKKGISIGNRVLGVVARELRWRGFGKVVSLAGTTV